MILDEIAAKTAERTAEEKKKVSLSAVRREAESMPANTLFPFEKALSGEDLSFICEVKKASPSKGLIAEDFDFVSIAKDYEKAGASAISCLTEPFWFKGADQYLTQITENVDIPVLRKDFTVDEYMIYRAKVMGASAVLLICAILSQNQLNEYYNIAKSLGLSVLVEAHDEKEIDMALNCGAKIIGVNNRNLKDFTVDINNSINLRKLVPNDVIYVSESGMKTAEDIARLYKNGVNAVLIGETLMRSPDKKYMLTQLRRGCKK
ncbi:MAG: indole-3-glycerol phosphate synthase TrpC [Firmicutes bacterium]|nr:indole-3-glycerol phosphate synthase TrpC [Bacillota bacterium]